MRSINFGEYFVERLWSPIEWMSFLVPFVNERDNLFLEIGKILKVRRCKALALKNRKPLLHLVHPGAMYRCEVHHKSRVFRKPCSHLLAMVRADVGAYNMNQRYGRWRFTINLFQKLDDLYLSLTGA